MNVTPSCSYMIFTECLFCAASVSSRTAHTISPPCPLLVDVFINCSLQNGAGSRSCMPGHCEFNLILSTTLVTEGHMLSGSDGASFFIDHSGNWRQSVASAPNWKCRGLQIHVCSSFSGLTRTEVTGPKHKWSTGCGSAHHIPDMPYTLLMTGVTRATNSAWHLSKINTEEQSKTSYKNHFY